MFRKPAYFYRRDLQPRSFPFLRLRGSEPYPETVCPTFFYSHVAAPSHRATQSLRTAEWFHEAPHWPSSNSRYFCPLGIKGFSGFFRWKKSYIQVYHDRITRPARQKMAGIHVIFDRKKLATMLVVHLHTEIP